MKSAQLSEMTKGWFVGNFVPSLYTTDACEVAVKTYVAGTKEAKHYHRISTEITVVISGTVQMMGRSWHAGDIVVLSPGEVTDFEAVTDAINVVVKLPGATNDKFLVED